MSSAANRFALSPTVTGSRRKCQPGWNGTILRRLTAAAAPPKVFPVKRLLLFLTGLLLLPLCWGAARALPDLFPFAVVNHPPWIAPSILALCAGYGVWTLVYLCMPPSVRVYIWGHELTHALWGLLTGARVGPIRVRSTGGSVALSEAGIWTTLAPYLVPFYTVIVVLLRLLLGLVVDMTRWELVWLFLVGLTWSFHITYTLRSLLQHQPDIQACGRLFSYPLILLFNLLLLGYLLVAASAAPLATFHARLFDRGLSAYHTTGRMLVHGTRIGLRLIPGCRPAQ